MSLLTTSPAQETMQALWAALDKNHSSQPPNFSCCFAQGSTPTCLLNLHQCLLSCPLALNAVGNQQQKAHLPRLPELVLCIFSTGGSMVKIFLRWQLLSIPYHPQALKWDPPHAFRETVPSLWFTSSYTRINTLYHCSFGLSTNFRRPSTISIIFFHKNFLLAIRALCIKNIYST